MRSLKAMSLKLLSLVAALGLALPLAACGGGGANPGTVLLLDGPVLTPPPATTLPDPIPMPPVDDDAGNPVEDVPPAEEMPPHEDPPPEPPTVDPAPIPAPDLARVSAMATVTANGAIAGEASEYAGLYVGDEDGKIWRLLESGGWKQVGEVGAGLKVEAMTYVPAKHALYLAIASDRGSRLLRWRLTPTPEVFDTSVEPPVLVDAGGVQLEELQSSDGETIVKLVNQVGAAMPFTANLTGLAFDTRHGLLHAWDHDLRGLFVIEDLEVADAKVRGAFTLLDGRLDDVQDMAYDALAERMLLVDAAKAELLELDHLGLAFGTVVGLPHADVRALTSEEDDTRRAVDRASAALVRYDRAGAVLE